MASTEWAWDVIDKVFDTQYIGTTLYGRDNWRIVRHFFSNDGFLSSLGDTAASLTGNNGGTARTITAAESITALNFLTSFNCPLNCFGSGADYGYANGEYRLFTGTLVYKRYSNGAYLTYNVRDGGTYWYDSAANYNGTSAGAQFPWTTGWEPSGSTYTVAPSFTAGALYPATNGTSWVSVGMHGSYPYYIESGNTETNVFLCWFSSTNAKWCCCEVPYLDAMADTFDDDYLNYSTRLVATTAATDINGVVFDGEGYLSAIGTMAATTATLESLFRCVADTPEYIKDGVNWYKRKQTWEKKGPWRAIS